MINFSDILKQHYIVIKFFLNRYSFSIDLFYKLFSLSKANILPFIDRLIFMSFEFLQGMSKSFHLSNARERIYYFVC